MDHPQVAEPSRGLIVAVVLGLAGAALACFASIAWIADLTPPESAGLLSLAALLLGVWLAAAAVALWRRDRRVRRLAARLRADRRFVDPLFGEFRP